MPMRFRWQFVGRFNDLPSTGSPGELIIKENERRRGLQLYNVGSGAVYIREDGTEITTRYGFPLRNGDASALSTAPFAPQNDLWAVGDAGHDLYIYEIVET